MPRTVEHIVECHKSAAALRAAGKPIWAFRLDLAPILHEDQEKESKEHISAISLRIGALLRARLPASFFDGAAVNFDAEFVDVVEELESCTIESLAQDEANGHKAVEMFNGWLEVLYDWADANRVWLGI